MSFGVTMSINLPGFDESQTLLASPSESHVLTMQVQPGVGFAAPRCLAFSDVLRTGFTAGAPPSASLAERLLRRTLVLSA